MALLAFIFSILVPPVGVFLKVGLAPQFWLNVLFTMMLWLPGAIHAVFFVEDRGKVRAA